MRRNLLIEMSRTRRPQALFTSLLLFAALAWARPVQAALQFDAFFGYEGIIHEAGWFPVTCEIFNDGPSFNAVIEVSSSRFGGKQKRQVPIELPTNTRKRVVIPMFSSGGRFASDWQARLLTTQGKLVQERTGQTQVIAREDVVLGSLARNFGGSPVLPEVQPSQRGQGPQVARMQVDQFPDNPIVLEGLDALYLHSEKALDLKVEQITALLGWVRAGGHLILAVEQPGDVNGTPWLKQFLPMEFIAVENRMIDQTVIDWIQADQERQANAAFRSTRPGQRPQGNATYANMPVDPAFQEAEMQVATGTLKDGVALASAEDRPLMVQAPRGRGKVTVLTFSPEREPFRSWKSRGYFWAKIAGIPPEGLTVDQQAGYGGWSVDGVFGALIDSRQIKKLPVSWLLLLLVVYLVVIGPLDQWWLKKIGRQMLTWITFPAYVVLFSLLIYFIGYKLRAGETEWNEFHIVDVLPRGEQVDLRGRTYISVYSSSNARYQIEGQEGYASFRTELMDLYSGGREDQEATIVQDGNSFKAQVFVPVWTSLLYANEWFQTNDTPFFAQVSHTGSEYVIEMENLLNKPLNDVRLAVDGKIFEAGSLAANERKTVRVASAEGKQLAEFVQQNGSHFQRAVELRRNPVGDTSGGQLEDPALTGAVVSLLSYLQPFSRAGREFVSPPGLDLSASVERGDAIVFAFAPDFSFTQKLNQFTPPRFQQDTLIRLTIPVRRTGSTI